MDPKLDQRRPIGERLGWDRQAVPVPQPASRADGTASKRPDRDRPERGRPEPGRAGHRGEQERTGRGAMMQRRQGPVVEGDLPRVMPHGGRPVHVWVCDIPEAQGTHPGVLLGWQLGGDGSWRGRVMMVAEGREGWVTMTLWVAARHLRSLDAPPTAEGAAERRGHR